MKKNTYFLFLLLFILFSGCGRRSAEDFKEEGEGITRSLIAELKAIHTKNQLLAASPRLQVHFERLVDVMIASEEFYIKHPHKERPELTQENHELSDRLRVELNRLYRIEGCRTIVEKSQKKALQRLEESRVYKYKN